MLGFLSTPVATSDKTSVILNLTLRFWGWKEAEVGRVYRL